MIFSLNSSAAVSSASPLRLGIAKVRTFSFFANLLQLFFQKILLIPPKTRPFYARIMICGPIFITLTSAFGTVRHPADLQYGQPD
ncbi:MAG: hypothetical protein KIG38_04510, partial [Bacteroidales bacterium]|nr:hypothetical protein [Bacteroidales bacterium]